LIQADGKVRLANQSARFRGKLLDVDGRTGKAMLSDRGSGTYWQMTQR
jgi:hypothetical protein